MSTTADPLTTFTNCYTNTTSTTFDKIFIGSQQYTTQTFKLSSSPNISISATKLILAERLFTDKTRVAWAVEFQNEDGEWKGEGKHSRSNSSALQMGHNHYLNLILNEKTTPRLRCRSGLPTDIASSTSSLMQTVKNSFGHRIVTLQQLLHFNWSAGENITGYVPIYEFIMYKQKGFLPNTWKKLISEYDRVNVLSREVAERAANGKVTIEDPGAWTYCVATYSFRDTCEYFYQETLPAMASLGDPKQVRAVYCFHDKAPASNWTGWPLWAK